jgi:solute carrier family 25 phosphate transporter 3
VCAACSHGITTPIDVVKTKIQTNPSKYKGGMLKAAKEIVAEEGPGYLLAGLGPTVVGYGLEGAAKFGFYESLKPISMKAIDNKAVAFLVASIVAGAVASILLCPMESTRIRLVTDPKFASGLITGLPKLIKEEGLVSTFDGLAAMLAKQVPYTLGKQVRRGWRANVECRRVSWVGRAACPSSILLEHLPIRSLPHRSRLMSLLGCFTPSLTP